jgi:ribosome recycling factor
MGEASRISVRTSRDESIKKIRAKEEDKSFTKDYAFKAKERVQKLVDDANDSIEQIVEKKIQDLSI